MPLVVVVPGLGLTSSAAPLADAVRARGVRCVVLDVPGYSSRLPATRPRRRLPGFPRCGRRPVPTEPSVRGVGQAVAAWVRAQVPASAGTPVTLVGHSTGAQAALSAALLLQDERPDTALVMVGPTFRPEHRRLGRLVLATPLAYRRESPREVTVVPEIVRGGPDLVRFLFSGMRDAPEQRLVRLRLPLTLVAGRADTFATEPWLRSLAARARQAPAVRVLRTDGSHNAVFTHPDQVASVVLSSRGVWSGGDSGMAET